MSHSFILGYNNDKFDKWGDNVPRPRKRRRVCSLPNFQAYGPVNRVLDEEELVTMKVEEFETIRLIDFEGLNQEQCAEKMDVARSTIQRIYDDARKKMADSLVNGKTLKIEGGNYTVCNEEIKDRNCSACCHGRHRHGMK